MTRLQMEGIRILNALDEGKVIAVLALIDCGATSYDGNPPDLSSERRRKIAELYLTKYIKMSNDDANYWLDYYGVER